MRRRARRGDSVAQISRVYGMPHELVNAAIFGASHSGAAEPPLTHAEAATIARRTRPRTAPAPGTVGSEILDLLSRGPATTAELRRALPDLAESTVRARIARLRAAGLVVRLGRRYRLAQPATRS